MDTGSKVAAIIFAVFILFMLFRFLKSNPESLTFHNLNKSMLTLGLLGVGLIVFIGLVVWLLRGM